MIWKTLEACIEWGLVGKNSDAQRRGKEKIKEHFKNSADNKSFGFQWEHQLQQKFSEFVCEVCSCFVFLSLPLGFIFGDGARGNEGGIFLFETFNFGMSLKFFVNASGLLEVYIHGHQEKLTS